MHVLEVGALVVFAVTWVGSYPARRFSPRLATALRLTSGVVIRFTAAVVFVAVAAFAASRGGLWLLLAAAFSLLAAASFGLAGLVVFVLLRGERA
jgi:hypothetical protein